MTQLGPTQVVRAAPAVPPRVGLVAAARLVDETDERWGNTFSFAPENCKGAGAVAVCGVHTKTVGANQGIVTFTPIGVFAGDKCSSFGFEARDYTGRAQRLLQASESKVLANEFWHGTIAQAESYSNAYLAQPGVDVATSGAADPNQALACLESALASCGTGAQGMIHCTRATAILWDTGGALRREAGYVLTINDTIVVADAGYDGSAPGGAAATAGHVWAYATSGLVEVRRGPIQVIPGSYAEAIDKSDNTITFRAERLAAATWDGCCAFGAEINMPICVNPGS